MANTKILLLTIYNMYMIYDNAKKSIVEFLIIADGRYYE